jgi:hypothetical protein
MPDTDHILPRDKRDWIAVIRNMILVLAMGGAAYGGTTAANETRLDRVESQVQRIEYRLDKVLERLDDNGKD